MYNGEERLLEIRLHELAPVVDGFILVEASTTHSGKPKSSMFSMDVPRGYSVKFLPVELPHKGDITDQQAAENEVYQRNMIAEMVLANDKIILSDLDEIPQREVIENVKYWNAGFMPYKIKLKTCYYYLNQEGPAPFCEYGPVVAMGSDVIKATPQMLRACIYSPDMPSLEGGWHFTFLGDIEKKMNEIAHHTEHHRQAYACALRGDVNGLKVYSKPLPKLVEEQTNRFSDWLKDT